MAVATGDLFREMFRKRFARNSVETVLPLSTGLELILEGLFATNALITQSVQDSVM